MPGWCRTQALVSTEVRSINLEAISRLTASFDDLDTIFGNLKTNKGLDQIVEFIERQGMIR